MSLDEIKTLHKKRFPKIDGDSIFSDVHKCGKVFPNGIYRVELPGGRFKHFRYESFYSVMLGPAFRVTEEVNI